MTDDRYSSPLIKVPLIPSRQCSFSGRRTVLMFQVSNALMLLGPVEPSNVVPPCVGGEHMYSEPDRLTPSRRTAAPVPELSLPFAQPTSGASRTIDARPIPRRT